MVWQLSLVGPVIVGVARVMVVVVVVVVNVVVVDVGWVGCWFVTERADAHAAAPGVLALALWVWGSISAFRGMGFGVRAPRSGV